MLPSRKSWCCEFGHIAVLDSTRASSQYCGFITEGLLVVVWKVLTYVVYILQNDDQYRRNPKIIKIGQNNQTFHILYIWLLVCQYRTSTHVQIKCLKTTIQWVPMHGLGLAIGPYIVSIIIYIYIYQEIVATTFSFQAVWLFASERGEAIWIWLPNQTLLDRIGFPKS